MFGFAVAPFKSGVSRHAVNCDGSKSYTGANAGAAAEYWTWRGFQMALCCGALSRWLSYTFSFPKPPIRTHVGLKMDSGREVQKEVRMDQFIQSQSFDGGTKWFMALI